VEAAYEPRSRRPHSPPTATPPATVDLIALIHNKLTGEGPDAGPATIAWYLDTQHRITISAATIARTLSAAALVTPQPHKRPRSSYIRLQAELPNQSWQCDFTHYRSRRRRRHRGLDLLDDHSRYACTSAPTCASPARSCSPASEPPSQPTACRPAP
jgi:hypothetical protein